MFDYQKLYRPYARKGHNLRHVAEWLKKTTGENERVISQVISSTMLEVAKGRQFPLPCPCGCGFEKPYTNASIDHYMRDQVLELRNQANNTIIKLIEDRDKQLLEERLKMLININKQEIEAKCGTWAERNLPTFRKFLVKK